MNLSDVKKCRERLYELENSHLIKIAHPRIAIYEEAINQAISILDKIIAGKLVEKYYENDEVTDDTQCDLYGDR